MKNFFKALIQAAIHIVLAITLIYYVSSFGSWYFARVPALGIDLFNSVTNVAILQKHFSLWFNGFKDISFGGNPLFIDFPRFQYYAMLPFANFFGTVKGVQVYVVFSLTLLILSSYVLFYRISKNPGISFLLSTLVFLSFNIYGSATWGGSIPYFGTQFFLPLVVALLITYFDTGSGRFLAGAALVAGLSFMSHPLPGAAFVLPISFIILTSYPHKVNFWKLGDRISTLFKFGIGVIFTAYMYFYSSVFSLISSFLVSIFSAVGKTASITVGSNDSSVPGSGDQIYQFYKSQIINLYTNTNNFIFLLVIIGLFIFILGLVIKKERSYLLKYFSLLVVVLYVTGHVYINLSGGSFLSQGLYRTFWVFPIVLGALAAVSWEPLTSFKNKFAFWLNIIIVVVIVPLSYLIFSNQFGKLIESIHKNSDTSSAFPEAISLRLEKKDQEELKRKLIPSFMDPNDKNKRLYASDATVNIWWNFLFDMPTARGYVDPPIGASRRGGFFMLDTSIGNDSLVRDFDYSEEMAKNYALFLIDWYGIYYFEGGHLSPNANVAPSSYLLGGDVFSEKEEVFIEGAIVRNETPSGRPEPRFDLKQSLIYYKVKDELTSPIAYESNSSPIMVFSSYDGYEQIWRLLAAENLNSKHIIPVWGGQKIDDTKLEDLLSFDAVIAHNYIYKNRSKAMKLLNEFVQNGGKLFIDTGGEVTDNDTIGLPNPLPAKALTRLGAGTSWDWEVTADSITDGVQFENFDPPIYNKDPWKFSYPTEGYGLKDNSKVILKNHGKPVLIRSKAGQGEIIWSGLNLAPHFTQYVNSEESKFFKQILKEIVNIEQKEILPVKVAWERPEKVIIKGNGAARGVIFKEQEYGWKAKLQTNRTSMAKVYITGPTYPGFMYIPLKDSKVPYVLTLNYPGELRFLFQTVVSFLAVIILLDAFMFDGLFIGKRIGLVYKKVLTKVGTWWEKEENY